MLRKFVLSIIILKESEEQWPKGGKKTSFTELFKAETHLDLLRQTKSMDCLSLSPPQILVLNLLSPNLSFPTFKLNIQVLSLIPLTNNFGAPASCKEQALRGRQ